MITSRRHFLRRASLGIGAVTLGVGRGVGGAVTAKRGIALTIGVNSVDPVHYLGWEGKLIAPEADARDMAEIAKKAGFETITLLTKRATYRAVTGEIDCAARTLQAGDVFLLYYSGHGGQLPDNNSDEIDDAMDETWCLYDFMLVDDDTRSRLAVFAKGVRIIAVVDSCHSGTSIKALEDPNVAAALNAPPAPAREADVPIVAKKMPVELAGENLPLKVYTEHKAQYDAVLNQPMAPDEDVQASVVSIAACADNQKAIDGTFNSYFTMRLKQVWANGLFRGDYRSFVEAIFKKMPSTQEPQIRIYGTDDPAFEAQKPFTI